MSGSRKAVVRFRERSELLDFLLEVMGASSETLDLDRLLANVSAIVKRVIDCEFLAILLYSEKTQRLSIRYAVGHRPEIINNLSLSLEEGLTGAAAKGREAVLVGDVRKDPRYLKAVDSVRTELAVPMLARQKLVGVLDVQSTRVNAYTEYDRALLRLIASRVAFSVENARLYRRVERTNRTLSTLAEISNDISSILDLDILLTRIATILRRLIQYDALSIFLIDEEAEMLRHRFSIRHDQRVDIQSIPLGKGITGAAAVAREVIKVDNTQTDARFIPTHPDVRSEIAVPLVVRDRVVGVMDVESDKLAYFNENHTRMLGLLAPQIASSIENARLYGEVAIRQKRIDQDLEAARELQKALLPTKPPLMDRLEVGVGLRPAREISGDLYDFFEHHDNQFGVAFGDVSGKGVAAALFGTMVGGLLRTLAPRRRSPAVLLKALNDALIERTVAGRYVTLLALLWDPESSEVRVANAGSLPPIVYRKGSARKLQVAGVPLGLLPEREYEQRTYTAETGDIMLLYSDGVTDHLNRAGEEFGRERVQEYLERNHHLPAQQIVNGLFDELDGFGDGACVYDDQTLMVFKVI